MRAEVRRSSPAAVLLRADFASCRRGLRNCTGGDEIKENIEKLNILHTKGNLQRGGNG